MLIFFSEFLINIEVERVHFYVERVQFGVALDLLFQIPGLG